jgi:two-component system response regulator AtoC
VDREGGSRREGSGEGSLREQVQKVEQEIILSAIAGADGDRKVAAQRLGISLSSLYRKLEDLDGDAVDNHQSHAVETR